MVYVTTINNICITTVSMLQTINLKLNTDDTAVKPTKMFFCVSLCHLKKISQPAITGSKLTIETMEQKVKYVQS